MSGIIVEGQCHCGTVRFTVATMREVEVGECNCSICSMCGYQHLIVEDEELTILEGEGDVTTYTFNTGTARHTFCRRCGIKPFYVPRSHPDCISVNARCLDADTVTGMTIEPFDDAKREAEEAAKQG